MSAPLEAYRERLGRRRAGAEALRRRERRISNARGAVFAGGALAWYLAIGPELVSPWWLAAALAAFGGLAAAHERTIRHRRRAERAAAFYERGIARVEDRWMEGGDDGARFADAAHPYAEDLDLFGPASLYQRLDAARTSGGKRTLAGWLRAPAPAAAVRERQEAVAELAPMLDFREQLALLGGDHPEGVGSEALAAWAGGRPEPFAPGARSASWALPLAPAVTLAGWIGLGWGPGPLLLAAAAELLAAIPWQGRARRILAEAARAAGGARELSRILARIEAEPFRSPRLKRLGSALTERGATPSRQLARLARLLDLVESRRNPLFAPFAALLLWDLHVALALEAWRARPGRRAPEWVAALGEIEALASLGAYAFECPGDPFPELLDEGPVFRAAGLGHPLIPLGRLVRNDVRLDARRALLVVSGSNMSGKSTLLRAVGVNAVLAQAGAPARAVALALSPLAVGASIRIHDSLHEGTSRFYAEIKRLRQIVDLAGGEPPLLFLLDEILHGTNSADRRVGAGAVVRGLVERGAVGLVTTHDLALAEIPGEIPNLAENVHFEDTIEGEAVRFDYRMRPGIVRKSNALALMRAMGLVP